MINTFQVLCLLSLEAVTNTKRVYVRRVSRTRDPQGCSNNVISIPTGGACNWYVVWLLPWIPAYSTHDQCRAKETCCRLNVQNLARWAAVATKSGVCIDFTCCRNPLCIQLLIRGKKNQNKSPVCFWYSTGTIHAAAPLPEELYQAHPIFQIGPTNSISVVLSASARSLNICCGTRRNSCPAF